MFEQGTMLKSATDCRNMRSAATLGFLVRANPRQTGGTARPESSAGYDCRPPFLSSLCAGFGRYLQRDTIRLCVFGNKKLPRRPPLGVCFPRRSEIRN